MPYSRPTLTDLQGQAASDISAGLGGADALLRFSNLRILGSMLAGMSHLHYGYLDWISKQSVPYTATDEFLEAWAGLKGVTRKPSTISSGQVTFTNCTPGTAVYGDTPLVGADGAEFIVTAGVTVGGDGTAVVSAKSAAPGAVMNRDVGSVLTLGVSLKGIQSSATVTTAFTGAADTESDDSLRTRMLAAYRKPPQGGDLADYVEWATSVPGVTRAWVTPNGFGPGTVVVYVMLDESEAAHNGFPQGSDGCAAAETRAAVATGDQLIVANAIFPLRPVTALVIVAAPDPHNVDLTISGLSGVSVDVQNQIAAAVADVLYQTGAVGGSINPDTNAAYGAVNLSDLEAAIAAVPGTDGFIIVSPVANITPPTGQLPVPGSITYV